MLEAGHSTLFERNALIRKVKTEGLALDGLRRIWRKHGHRAGRVWLLVGDLVLWLHL